MAVVTSGHKQVCFQILNICDSLFRLPSFLPPLPPLVPSNWGFQFGLEQSFGFPMGACGISECLWSNSSPIPPSRPHIPPAVILILNTVMEPLWPWCADQPWLFHLIHRRLISHTHAPTHLCIRARTIALMQAAYTPIGNLIPPHTHTKNDTQADFKVN